MPSSSGPRWFSLSLASFADYPGEVPVSWSVPMLQPSPSDKPDDRPQPKPVHHTESSVDDQTGGLQEKPGPGEDTLDFLAPAQSPEEIGRLAQYRVLKELGRGGMGVVLLAEDPQLERQVALKIMLPRFAQNATAKERFLREAKAAAKVHHEHVITIHQIGEERGVPFIALEYLQGAPLDRYLQDKAELPLGVALRIACEVAEGLHAAHQRGLVHRDIKPGNIWLEAPKDKVKILDFGLARLEQDDTHLTQSGAILGTPAFMAPEQARGEKIDGRADLFSLGVVLYRLCTGKQPFAGSTTMAVLLAIANETPQPARELNAKIPPALEKIIHRLLEKDPAQRCGSAKELSADLKEVMKALADEKAALGSTEALAKPVGPRRSGDGKTRPWPLLAGLAGLAVAMLVLLATSGYFIVRGLGKPNGTAAAKTTNRQQPEKPPFAGLPFGEATAKQHQADWAAYLKVPVEVENKIGMKLVLIPPAGNSVPRAYYIGKYEVTQQQWQKVMGWNASAFQAGAKEQDKVKGLKSESFPVEFVTWYDCVAFCNKLSQLAAC